MIKQALLNSNIGAPGEVINTPADVLYGFEERGLVNTVTAVETARTYICFMYRV